MLLEKIKAWLVVPEDYQAGLALLCETGYKGYTLTVLTKGENAYNRGRVEQELQKWVETQNSILPIGTRSGILTKENLEQPMTGFQASMSEFPAKAAAPKPDQNPSPNREPSEVQTIKKQIYALMDERVEAVAWIRAKEDLGNSPEACAVRLPYAIRVKVITRQIDELYSQLDFFEEHGYLPPVSTDQAIIVDDTKQLMNIRSYVSRYEAKLRKKDLTPKQRESAESLLKQYREEKARLEIKLSKINDSYSTGQQTEDSPNNPPAFSGT